MQTDEEGHRPANAENRPPAHLLEPEVQENRRQRFLLERIIQEAPAAIAFVEGPKHRYSLVNPAFEQIARDKGELLGHTVADVWPEIADGLVPLFDKVYQSREPYRVIDMPFTINRMSGPEEDYFTFTLTPLLEENGEVEGILILAVETTEQVRAQMQVEAERDKLREAMLALQESEVRFRMLADSMPQLVWTAQPDGVVDYYNQRYQEYKGITPEAGGSWKWAPVLHPDDEEPTVAAWQRSVATGELYQVEHRVLMANGSYCWRLSRAVPVRDQLGQIVKWYGTATDIHHNKQIEQALQTSENRIRKLVEANLVGVFYRDESGSFKESNQAFLDTIGYTREELLEGKVHWLKITPQEHHQLDREKLEEAKALGACKPYEKEYIRKNGSRVPVMIGYTPVDDAEDEFIGFIIDLTELKKAQAALVEYAQKLEHSNRELEEFAFVASHDLQEPLRKIRSFSEFLLQRAAGKLNEEERDYLSRMMNAAARMQRMISDLLTLSRVTTTRQPFVPVDLSYLVEETLSDLENAIIRSSGRVEIGELPVIQADPMQMRQLFQNLIGNALKFYRTGIPPHVKVSASASNIGGKPAYDKSEQLTISVEDNGIGFAEQDLELVFQPFQRLVKASEYDGTGIGLAICRKIVERHGGSLTAHSKPGQGSVFMVTLPNGQTGAAAGAKGE